MNGRTALNGSTLILGRGPAGPPTHSEQDAPARFSASMLQDDERATWHICDITGHSDERIGQEDLLPMRCLTMQRRSSICED
jgi:hypothetical protein